MKALSSIWLMKKTALLTAAAATTWVLTATTPVSADTLYTQAANFVGGFASQTDVNPAFDITTYDNFSLPTASNITSVGWVGSYFDPATQGAITAFTITLYADNAGKPGALLASTGDVASNAGETFLRNDNAGSPTYAYNLNTAFLVAGGTHYWLSIVADLPHPPEWGWEAATGPDGSSYLCGPGGCGSEISDVAFTLSGTAVPEPGSAVLLATALCIGLIVRAATRNRYRPNRHFEGL
jgi:hypothetical protein